MTTPKQGFARSLRTQNQGTGREEPPPTVQQQRRGGPTMTVPGEGSVCPSPGRADAGRQSRSAAQFAPIVGSRFGGGSATE
jgi:hypothetical protein